jgi:hypothetical protein
MVHEIVNLIRDHIAGKPEALPILADLLDEKGDERTEGIRAGQFEIAKFFAEANQVWTQEHKAACEQEFRHLTAVKAGKYVEPDGWAVGSCLMEDETGMAPFRLQSARYADIAYPVNVTVTGRTYQHKHGSKRVRVKVEFVHDAEESTVHGGWMVV